MNAKRFHLSLIFWLVMLAPLAWAESFPNRPTPAELNIIVELGTECVNGANERCYATQYATNPVRYRVDPPFVKTNSAIGWNLNTNRLGQLASTARTLVRWYADPATVYDRSPNISMLTVTGVWAQLGIGDRNSNFTATAASGTNAATYRDYPPRVYRGHLVERYKVLNALEMTKIPPIYAGAGPNGEIVKGKRATAYGGSNYNDLVSAWNRANWTWLFTTLSFGSFGNRSFGGTDWEFDRASIHLTNVSFYAHTNLTPLQAAIYGKTETSFGAISISITQRVYYEQDFGATVSGSGLLIAEFPLPDKHIASISIGEANTIYGQAIFEANTAKGYNVRPENFNVYTLWDFRYCMIVFW